MATSAAAALVVVALAPGASAAAKKRPPKPPPKAPLPGWVVDRVRFEPVDGSPLGVQGVGEYRGSIEVAPVGGGLAIINHVGFDDYLRGISEVPVSWPAEAQKAQAIAARTYALWEMGREVNAAYKNVGADICATQSCQVYAGLGKERRPGSEAWTLAVDATKNQVLVYRGRPILAKYSSSNGGRSVAGGQPYLQVVDDPDDRQSPLHEWRSAFTLDEVTRAWGLPARPLDVRRAGHEVIATTVDAEGTAAEQRLPVDEFRDRLNDILPAPDGLPLAVPSMRFEAATYEDQLVILGRGWGHGIGLSQFGALGKALRGMKAPDILAAYYAGLRPVSAPADAVPTTVKVALSVDRGGASIVNPTGRFRVVDGAGNVLAHGATGVWNTVPFGGGKVRVVAPADQAGPPTATGAAIDPASALTGRPVAVRLRLDGPAAVTRLMAFAPDGTGAPIGEPALRGAGELTVHLLAGTDPGAYRLDVERDAGGGRVAVSSITVDVAPSPPAPVAVVAALPPAPTGPGPLRDPVRVAATSLLLAVSASALQVGRKKRRPLH